jgi:hypothetical protein
MHRAFLLGSTALVLSLGALAPVYAPPRERPRTREERTPRLMTPAEIKAAYHPGSMGTYT